MKSRINNNTIVEILVSIDGFAIEDCFHPAVLAMCIDTPEGAEVGWTLKEDGTWSAPPVVEPVAPPVVGPVTEVPTE